MKWIDKLSVLYRGERMDEDIDMMMSAGMNVVRIAESTWSTLEPEEGIFNFSYRTSIKAGPVHS